MRLGGDSTNIKKLFLKLKDDYSIIKKHNLNIFILFYKILSKITQIKKTYVPFISEVEEFNAIMNDFKYKWFNDDTIKFFKEQCGCSEFFN